MLSITFLAGKQGAGTHFGALELKLIQPGPLRRGRGGQYGWGLGWVLLALLLGLPGVEKGKMEGHFGHSKLPVAV